MPNANENQALTIDGVQGAIETASVFAPSSLEFVFSFALGALSMLAVLLGVQKVLRDKRAKRIRACTHCSGTGEEQPVKKGPEPCGECDGAGTVEEELEQGAECAHCKGEGEDPCHACKGTGKDASGKECAACRGGGKTLEDPEDADSEIAGCEICGGEGEVSAAITHQVTCEKCGGTGKV